MIKANNIEWDQGGNKLIISLFDIPFGLNEQKLANLFSELCSKNVMFSLSFTQDKHKLIIYRKHNLSTNYMNKEKKLFDHLITSYSLLPSTDFSELYLDSFKIKKHDSILKLLFKNGSEIYLFAYILTAIKSDNQAFPSRFTKIIQDCINSKLVSITISSLPSISKSAIEPAWGLMIYSRSNSREDLILKHKKFKHFLKNLAFKAQCILTPISKKDVIRHNANFRLLVPWRKQTGFFQDSLNITKLVKRDKNDPNLFIKTVSSPKTKVQTSKPVPEEIKHKNRKPRKPFPSIKNIDIQALEGGKKNNQLSPSTINDVSIPSPRTINTVFDTEYFKVRINNLFKELDFKETVIFEDIFDLVLRKGSYYIFVKFYKNIFNQEKAYKIVENLSSIAGLRNQFLCLVVADVIEENSIKLLNEFNILHLTISDILLDEKLKTKLYNTVVI